MDEAAERPPYMLMIDEYFTVYQRRRRRLVSGKAPVGLAGAPVQTAAMEAARADEAGQAAGLFSTMRYLGSILGAAGMAAILGSAADEAAFRVLFALLVLAAGASAVASSRLPGGRVPSP